MGNNISNQEKMDHIEDKIIDPPCHRLMPYDPYNPDPMPDQILPDPTLPNHIIEYSDFKE